jgi:hypothetical protein
MVHFVSYVYLMRVPLLLGGVLLLLPFAALLWMKTLLQNLFILTVQGTMWTTAIALVLTWSIMLTSRLVLLNGKDRFDLPQALTINTLKARYSVLIWLLAIPLIVAQFTQKDFNLHRPEIVSRLIAIAGGALIAYLLAFAGLVLTMWLNPPGLHPAEDTFPAPKFVRNALKKWASKHNVEAETLMPLGRFFKKWPKSLTDGYVEPPTGIPWAGHWMAFSFAFATFMLYWGLDLYRRMWPGGSSPIPALAYVLLLLLNANWFLAFFSFLLDRYRVPLLVLVCLICIAGAQPTSSDHYYFSEPTGELQKITPYDILHARQGRPLIVVATAGGGIQAGAWTVRVLTGLQKESQAWKTPDTLADSIALVSSVSGGATGSMYFLNLYDPSKRPIFDDSRMDTAQKAVMQSSLDDIAWAMVYKDLWRIFFPYLKRDAGAKILDRGYMLEDTWRNRGDIRSDLGVWRAGVKEGLRPAAIFNSTISETGEPLLLATTQIDTQKSVPRRQNFYDLYQNTDLPVVTAVRLAATFPYVTPAARSLSDELPYHMIDGGYYDNPGVSSVINWLDDGLRKMVDAKEELPSHVLIIQIRSFPESTNEPQAVGRGWFFQTYAPLDGLLNVRTTAQLLRDRDALTMLAQRWAASPTSHQGSLQDRIRFATFTFNGNDAPLSWAMNEAQKNAIHQRWDELVRANTKDLRWVHCTLDAASPACQTSEENGPY